MLDFFAYRPLTVILLKCLSNFLIKLVTFFFVALKLYSLTLVIWSSEVRCQFDPRVLSAFIFKLIHLIDFAPIMLLQLFVVVRKINLLYAKLCLGQRLHQLAPIHRIYYQVQKLVREKLVYRGKVAQVLLLLFLLRSLLNCNRLLDSFLVAFLTILGLCLLHRSTISTFRRHFSFLLLFVLFHDFLNHIVKFLPFYILALKIGLDLLKPFIHYDLRHSFIHEHQSLVYNNGVDGQVGHVVLSASQVPGANTFSHLLQRAKFISVNMDSGFDQQNVAVGVLFVNEERDSVPEFRIIESFKYCGDRNELRGWLFAVEIKLTLKHLL